MNKILIAPDSFKGTFSAQEVCEIIADTLKKELFDYQIDFIPLADGGEGSLQCILTCFKCKVLPVNCTDLFFNKITAPIAFFKNDSAFIESASCVGLKSEKSLRNPCISTTYGIGEQILFAKNNGAKQIYVSLGGSGTNDFGCGLACALGAKFFDANGCEFMPVGSTLKNVKKIDLSILKSNLEGVKIIALCDVDNTPFGKNGASYIYAPQKGASKADCELLDNGVKNLCEVVLKEFNVDLSGLKGGGAAGAMGAGLVAFCNADIKSGVEFILKISNFERLVKSYDLIITGEGCTDSQSLNGKLLSGVINVANKNNLPLIVLSGIVKDDISLLLKKGITKIYATVDSKMDFEKVKPFAKQNLIKCAKLLASDIASGIINKL